MEHKALKSHVERVGGIRLATHGGLRDQIVDAIVQEWPRGCDPTRIEEVLVAKVSRRVKKNKNRIYGLFVCCMIVRPAVRAALEWYYAKASNRVLMEGWSAKASKNL